MARILVTGASGYIGRRIIPALLAAGHEVFALLRVKGIDLYPEPRPNLNILYGDLYNDARIEGLPQDIDAAYYLMHSMSDAGEKFPIIEEQVAHHFLSALEGTHVRQIIYLSGIIPQAQLSRHLQSRYNVEKILRDGPIPCTVLRASIIIGAGSAPFEIIRDLVEKLPVMVAPRWLLHLCQPISIVDVVFYLTAVLLKAEAMQQVFDIGGPEVMTFKDALLRFAKVRKLPRLILTVPFLTPTLSSYWLVFVTTVRYSLASYLVESMKSHSYCLENRIRDLFPHECLQYEQAIARAFQKIEQNDVLSTWMDAWDAERKVQNIGQYVEVPRHGCLTNVQRMPLKVPFEEAVQRIWTIGGDRGWYALDWAWTIRGYIDKLVGGVGMNRGRRHPEELFVGDSLDFWRVLKADKQPCHLILFATMKVPGEAWLEFRIDSKGQKPTLIQTATFRPRGIIGRLYWYVMLPFHYFIFGRMARAIAQ